ncbi:protease adaptor protein RcdA [Aminobacter sp. Piv2-1]|uniref:protease adaptor protein RcdA n=1 Tax=Aminobacter sp. Piv2-1 TaxID=3031122 RepID=UPI0030A64B48
MNEPSRESANTIKLAERRVFSPSFKPLYNEGMGLVERAAEYLDGAGRVEAKKLSRLAATLYAAESMRLTTRLMQIASWLLLQRAANSGEMTRDQVASEKSKVRLDTASAHDDAAGWNELPADFVDLVRRSLRLQALVRRMDEEIYGTGATVMPVQPMRRSNPVSDQINLLNTAFARN